MFSEILVKEWTSKILILSHYHLQGMVEMLMRIIKEVSEERNKAFSEKWVFPYIWIRLHKEVVTSYIRPLENDLSLCYHQQAPDSKLYDKKKKRRKREEERKKSRGPPIRTLPKPMGMQIALVNLGQIRRCASFLKQSLELFGGNNCKWSNMSRE